LRRILKEAIDTSSPDAFLIHREIKVQQARGREIQDQYNSIIAEQKKDREMLIAFHNREEELTRKRMRNDILAKYRWDLPPPSKI
jgi:hypothetical protein